MRAFLCLLILGSPILAYAERPVSVGVKGGVLLGPNDETRRIATRRFGQQRDYIRPYVVGPAVVVDLPVGKLRFEADMLYRRLSSDLQGRQSTFLFSTERYSANSWEFPMLLERRLPFGLFAGGGASIRHVWNLTVETETFESDPNSRMIQPREGADAGDSAQLGWVFAAGLERKVAKLRWSVEGRYTRWNSLLFQPSRHQTDLLVGIRF